MPRRFSEEEAQRVFARVAERQRRTPGADDGLSLGELEEAARAAGLDPSLVAAAAAELDAPPGERRLAGAPVEVVRQRVVPGPLDDDAWGRMVALARAEFGDAGVAGQVGRLREWTCARGRSKRDVTRLTAEPTAEGARLTLAASVRDEVRGGMVAVAVQAATAVLFLLLWAFGADPDLWIPMLLMVALGVLTGVGTQVGARVWHRRSASRVEGVLDRLELAALETARGGADQEAPAAEFAEDVGPSAPRLDLDALAEPEETGADVRGGRRRTQT